jgi:NitT/TauT family transport system substrate-binding protein
MTGRSFSKCHAQGLLYWLVALLTVVSWGDLRAETNEVRFAEQPGLSYLPLVVAIDQKLVEKHASAMGLGGIKVTVHKFSGAGAANQALLSNSVDFSVGGLPAALTLWDKTIGTPIEVRVSLSYGDMAMKLVTNDPRVKTIRDYVGLTDHKIATPSVKVSSQAIFLQMAAEKEFGKGQQFKLDDMTVTMPHPQAAAAILSGGLTVKSHFASLPFQTRELASGKARLVLSSYDVMGGKHIASVMFNTKRWKEANPKTFQAVSAAFVEAHRWINEDPMRAATLYKNYTKTSEELDEIVRLIKDDGEISYDPVPKRSLQYAEFLHRIGTLNNQAKSWKDFFWENNYQFDGS